MKNLKSYPNLKSHFLIDWLGFSTKLHSVDDLIVLLGLEDQVFEESAPQNFFGKVIYFSGIKIYSEPTQLKMEGFVSIQMSGKGCRTFETVGSGDWEGLLNHLTENLHGVNITRFDYSFDDLDKILNFNELIDLTLERDEYGRLENLVTESKTVHVDLQFTSQKSTETPKGDPTAGTIYWGSKKSEFFIRAYDKAREQNCDLGVHWIRYEMQMRRSHAENFLKMGFHNFSENFLGILRKKVRYIEQTSQDTNKSRWDEHPIWKKFFDFFGKIEPRRLFATPGMDLDFEKMKDYVVAQAGQAIETLVEILGVENVLGLIKIHRYHRTKDVRYQEILNKCQNSTLMEDISEMVSFSQEQFKKIESTASSFA